MGKGCSLHSDPFEPRGLGPRGALPVICRVGPEAVPDIALIERESNSPPWSPRLFQQEFSSRCSEIHGARLNGALVGFIVVHTVLDEAHIVNFGVAASSRRRGVGRALLAAVLRELRDREVRWVTLEVRESNRIARGLYGSFGFFEVGLRRRYYTDNDEDGLILKVDLLNLQQA